MDILKAMKEEIDRISATPKPSRVPYYLQPSEVGMAEDAGWVEGVHYVVAKRLDPWENP